MSARSSRIPSRTTTLLVVAAAHGLVLWMIWRTDVPVVDEVETIASVLFFLPENSRTVQPPADARVSRAAASTHAAAGSIARVQPQPLISLRPAGNSSTAITVPSASGAGVDWSTELSAAADSTLKKEKQARDQLGVFTRKFLVEADPRNPGRTTNRGFRWYEAGTHRIDTRGGIPVLHLNDRCVLVAFIIPACAIGHIEIHGDLFENMAVVLDENEATPRPNDVP
jgi:hypothetical protein